MCQSWFALDGGEVVRAEDTAERGAMRAVRITREIAGGKTGKEQVRILRCGGRCGAGARMIEAAQGKRVAGKAFLRIEAEAAGGFFRPADERAVFAETLSSRIARPAQTFLDRLAFGRRPQLFRSRFVFRVIGRRMEVEVTDLPDIEHWLCALSVPRGCRSGTIGTAP